MTFTLVRWLTFVFVIFNISYFIYGVPVFSYLKLFDFHISYLNQLIVSSLITILIYIYLQTKITFFLLKFFIYGGMAAGFYGLILTGFFSLLHFFIIETYAQQLIPILLFLILIYGTLNARKLKTRLIHIQSNNVSEPKKLAFISDVHLGSQSISHLKRIIRVILTNDVDVLLIGGDLIDSSSFDLNQLDVLTQLEMPIYFVTGNHEYYLKDFEKKISQLSHFNINNIDFKSTSIGDIRLIGIGDNVSISDKQKYLNTITNDDSFTILMVHQPSLWPMASDHCDLMLSGHTHAGQMVPFHYLVRLQFPYYYGLYKKNDSLAYVTSGSGCWGPNIRLGSENEIVLISIDSTKR